MANYKICVLYILVNLLLKGKKSFKVVNQNIQLSIEDHWLKLLLSFCTIAMIIQ